MRAAARVEAAWMTQWPGWRRGIKDYLNNGTLCLRTHFYHFPIDDGFTSTNTGHLIRMLAPLLTMLNRIRSQRTQFARENAHEEQPILHLNLMLNLNPIPSQMPFFNRKPKLQTQIQFQLQLQLQLQFQSQSESQLNAMQSRKLVSYETTITYLTIWYLCKISMIIVLILLCVSKVPHRPVWDERTTT